MTEHDRLPRMMLHLIVALALAFALHASETFAQDSKGAEPKQAPAETTPAAADVDAEPAEAKVEPIAAADIAPQAEEFSARLREIKKLAEPDQATSDVAEKLSETTQEISRISQNLAASPPVSLRGVSVARQHWSSLDGLLGGWQKQLQKRSTTLQEAHDELTAQRKVWEVTRSDELPESVLQQIDAVLSELDATQTLVGDRLKNVLTLQGDVSKQRDSTSKATGQLDEIEASQRSNLLVRDQDPLWRAFASDSRDLSSEFSKSRAAIEAASTEFYGRYRAHLVAHTAMLVFLVILIWMTRGAVSAGAMSDREVQRVSIVLARPFATALLISIVMMRLVYPIASSEIAQLGRVIILFPLLRLLPKLMPRFRWVLVLLAVVYFVDTVSQLALEGSLLQRLILLASTILAILALGVGLLLTYRHVLFDRAGTRRVARVLGYLAVLGLIISLVANVMGTMALASLLATAMLNAIWAAVVLHVVMEVISALLILVLRSPIARLLSSVRNASEIIHRRIVGVLRIGLTLTWIVLVLDWLQLWQPISKWGETSIGHEWAVGSLQISVGSIASFIIAIVIAVVVSMVVRFFLEQDVLSRLSLPRGAPATISTLVHYTIIGIGLIVALAASGMDISKLGFIVGALGVGIGFGLQNVVNNFVSGLILIFERPVKVGDLIELAGTKGNVTRIGARSSTMKTFAGAEVIIPNGDLISSAVTNWTLSDQKRRIEVQIPLPLGSDTRRVIEILVSAARDVDIVLDEPSPFALFDSFDETGMAFVLRAWPTIGTDVERARNEVVASAIDALREAGFDMSRPQREIHVRQKVGPEVGDSTSA